MFRRIALSVLFSASLLTMFATPAQAQFGICQLLGPIGQPFGCSNGEFGNVNVAGDYLLPRVQFVLSLLFVGLILFAIFYVVRAAITYIQSQGQPDKIAEATKAIRAVFVGLGALFVGIAGILLVLSFFGGPLSGSGENQNFDLRCLDRPECCPAGGFDSSRPGCAQ